MRAISFKGTDVSLLPPCCQIKCSVEDQWWDASAFLLNGGNMISSDTPGPKVHVIGLDHHGLLGPGPTVKIYCGCSNSGIEALQRSCIL